MDLYSSGGSITQTNQNQEAARASNRRADDFNNDLAAKLDNAKVALDSEAYENQAINLYKGSTAGTKFVGMGVPAIGRTERFGRFTAGVDAVARGTKFEKVAGVTGRIEVADGLADIDDLRRSQPALQAARRYPMSSSALEDLRKESLAALKAGKRGLAREAGEVTTSAIAQGSFRTAASSGRAGARAAQAAEAGGAVARGTTTALGSGSIATAGTRAVKAPTLRLSERVGGGAVARASITGPGGSLMDQSMDVSNPLARSGGAAESTTARALEDIPAATLKPARAGLAVGGDAAKAAKASARAANTAAAGKVASKVAVKEGEEVAAKVGGTAVAKGLVAGLGGGLDIYKDINRGLQGEAVFGDNTLQEIGNIGSIVGSAMEIGGILTAWTGFGVGLEIAGAGISLASAGIEAAGDVKAAGDKETSVTDDITSERRGQAAATRQTQVVARSN